MDKVYPVLSGERRVGTARVKKCGLYYRIQCCCDLKKEALFRIIVSVDNKEVNLGICVPMGEQFGLETQIPVKRLGEGELSFRAAARNDIITERFIPIRDDEPFFYLAELNKAHLSERDGIRGVLIQE